MFIIYYRKELESGSPMRQIQIVNLPIFTLKIAHKIMELVPMKFYEIYEEKEVGMPKRIYVSPELEKYELKQLAKGVKIQ